MSMREKGSSLLKDKNDMALAYTINVQTPAQLVDIMTEQGIYLPMNISLYQISNIRFILITQRLRQIPFDIIKIEDSWFIDRILNDAILEYLKCGDRLLVVNNTMISELDETDIFKFILYSSLPIVLWVTWDADTYLKNQAALEQGAYENAYINAKAYLLKTTSYLDISLYDHLSLILAQAIRYSSVNMADLFEKLSRDIKSHTQGTMIKTYLRDPHEKSSKMDITLLQRELLKTKSRELLQPDDFVIKSVPYVMDVAYFCSSAGYGMHMSEFILIWAAMKKLENQIEYLDMKFWGKIFGIYCDYYIIQLVTTQDVLPDEIDISDPFPRKKHSRHKSVVMIDGKQEKTMKSTYKKKDNSAQKSKIQSMWQPSLEIPAEERGKGINYFTYFVCNSPGFPWQKLPDAKPLYIQQARQIRSLFTGCLTAQVNGYPPFEGVEKDYLRAQIARITATTHVAPAGHFIATEDGEEMFEGRDEGAGIELNPDNEAIDITSEMLASESLDRWVHHVQEILPQGRTSFWKPEKSLSDVSEEDEENEQTEIDEIQIPAPLLQPINEDKELPYMRDKQKLWSVGLTLNVMHEYALCYLRSNVWPGAFTLAQSANFINLYVGWGQKYEPFEPAKPSAPQHEYSTKFDDATLIEINDPTVEQEQVAKEIKEAAEETGTEETDVTDYDGSEETSDED
ncbi:unnamed protein product [Didymodactylos carnosus]|uniref:Uncharacterized protein n=1 Tax=Didymodactylos carnosus TaxID=1234261 RepID=A0A813UXC5_9BILA|nr:unnamed protein product [Didymodactylos carnosus]CAF0864167.1 unnamed protein product [Didymodactylos carnosus]CAF3621087.1 unnamed protein product [Didymodactylos carnosus]CAF3648958.1 unnamed protein product [Didymodactylos carnosus]